MKKEIPFIQSLLIICIIAVLFTVTLAYWKVSAAYGLFIGTLISSIFAFINGYSIKEIAVLLINGVKKFYSVMLTMLLIGIITGVWLYCGIIPATVYFGLHTIQPSTFLLSAFLICTLLSIIMGTGIGTISTVGVALLIIGKGLGIPDCITAGAIISGSFIGCRSSFMSPMSILTANMSETDLRDMLKYSLTTLFPAFMISLLIYFITGLNIDILNDRSAIDTLMATLSGHYSISIWLLIPPLLIIILSLFKIPLSTALLTGLLSGAVLGLVTQNISLPNIAMAAVFGYQNTLDPQISQIIKGGGAISMSEMLVIIISASTFNGILSGTRVLQSLLGDSIHKLRKGTHLIFYTIILSLVSAVFGCTQIIAIVIPSEFLRSSYEKFNVSKLVLARSLCDSGVMISPIIPWNVCALVPSAVMSVPVLQYAPYAVICFLLPLVNIIFTLAGLYKKEMPNTICDKSVPV